MSKAKIRVKVEVKENGKVYTLIETPYKDIPDTMKLTTAIQHCLVDLKDIPVNTTLHLRD